MKTWGKNKKENTAMKIKIINQKGRLLTSDDLMALYAQHHVEIKAEVTEKEKNKVAQDKHSEAIKKNRMTRKRNGSRNVPKSRPDMKQSCKLGRRK